MLIGKAPDILYSEITPKALYLRRREFIQAASSVAIAAAAALRPGEANAQGRLAKLPNIRKSPFSTTETPNDYDDITSYTTSTSSDRARAIRRRTPAASNRSPGRWRSKGCARSPASTRSTTS